MVLLLAQQAKAAREASKNKAGRRWSVVSTSPVPTRRNETTIWDGDDICFIFVSEFWMTMINIVTINITINIVQWMDEFWMFIQETIWSICQLWPSNFG